MPTNNIIVLDSYLNVTNKSNLIDKRKYDFWSFVILADFFGPFCINGFREQPIDTKNEEWAHIVSAKNRWSHLIRDAVVATLQRHASVVFFYSARYVSDIIHARRATHYARWLDKKLTNSNLSLKRNENKTRF